ncbi:MAG: hypothetical protein HONBIEJF_03005 [Fimbriimonadaceae bacterium]|nr:hypothetical protein [Fimbriimonadaceae bacterium]
MIAACIAGAILGSPWTLALGGDVMLNGIGVKARPLSAVKHYFWDADVAVVNLEIPLTNRGKATSRKSLGDRKAKRQFVLRADPGHIGRLVGCGVDIVTLGNNHAMDYGWPGLSQMLNLLESKGIEHSGAGEFDEESWNTARFTTSSGVRVGVLSVLAFMSTGGLGACTPSTPTRPGVAALDLGGSIDQKATSRLRTIVSSARQDCDFLIVAPHWGIEKKALPSTYQVALGRALVDAGADMVAGAHPHVLQGGELYKGKSILYSMGNLISPRPGSTAVFVASFEGTRLKALEARGCSISGGKVKPTAGDGGFKGLSTKLRQAYPSKESKDLPIRAYRLKSRP